MVSGKAVIASNIGGIPEALDGGKCGLLVPPADHGAISDAIIKLIENQELRNKFSSCAIKKAKKELNLKIKYDLKRSILLTIKLSNET